MIGWMPPRRSVRAKCSAKSNAARINATPKTPTRAAVPVKPASAQREAPALLSQQVAARNPDVVERKLRDQMCPMTQGFDRTLEDDPALRPLDRDHRNAVVG